MLPPLGGAAVALPPAGAPAAGAGAGAETAGTFAPGDAAGLLVGTLVPPPAKKMPPYAPWELPRNGLLPLTNCR